MTVPYQGTDFNTNSTFTYNYPRLPSNKEKALELALQWSRNSDGYVSPEGVVSAAHTFEKYLGGADAEDAQDTTG